MCLFPRAAVTNDHKLSGSKQYSLLRYSLGGQKSEMGPVSEGLGPFWNLQWRIWVLDFSRSERLPAILGLCPFLPPSSKPAVWPLKSVSDPLPPLPLIRTLGYIGPTWTSQATLPSRVSGFTTSVPTMTLTPRGPRTVAYSQVLGMRCWPSLEGHYSASLRQRVPNCAFWPP